MCAEIRSGRSMGQEKIPLSGWNAVGEWFSAQWVALLVIYKGQRHLLNRWSAVKYGLAGLPKMRLQKSLLSTLYYMETESSLSEPDFKYIAIFINNDFYGITDVYFRICIFYVQCVTGAQRISLIAATLRSGFCYYLRPIGNRSLIGSGNEGQRPEKRLYLWPGRCFRYRRPRKGVFFWTGRYQ